MTPTGSRGFGDVASVKAAVKAKPEITTYAIIRNNSRPFMPPEFAWIAPAETFIERAPQAMMAGISLVELVTG